MRSLLFILILLVVISASAQTFYTNTGAGNLTDATKWTPSAPVSANTTVLVWTSTVSPNLIIVTNNYSGTFIVNGFMFLNTTNVTITNNLGSFFQFTNNGSQPPFITNAFSVTNTIACLIQLTNNGISTFGTNLISGVVSGFGGFTNISGKLTLTAQNTAVGTLMNSNGIVNIVGNPNGMAGMTWGWTNIFENPASGNGATVNLYSNVVATAGPASLIKFGGGNNSGINFFCFGNFTNFMPVSIGKGLVLTLENCVWVQSNSLSINGSAGFGASMLISNSVFYYGTNGALTFAPGNSQTQNNYIESNSVFITLSPINTTGSGTAKFYLKNSVIQIMTNMSSLISGTAAPIIPTTDSNVINAGGYSVTITNPITTLGSLYVTNGILIFSNMTDSASGSFNIASNTTVYFGSYQQQPTTNAGTLFFLNNSPATFNNGLTFLPGSYLGYTNGMTTGYVNTVVNFLPVMTLTNAPGYYGQVNDGVQLICPNAKNFFQYADDATNNYILWKLYQQGNVLTFFAQPIGTQ